MLPTVVECLSNAKNQSSPSTKEELRTIPYTDWLEALESASLIEGGELVPTIEATTKNPALKLLDFYTDLSRQGQSFSPLSTDKTSKVSEVMQTLEPIRAEWMSGWIRDWLNLKKG